MLLLLLLLILGLSPSSRYTNHNAQIQISLVDTITFHSIAMLFFPFLFFSQRQKGWIRRPPKLPDSWAFFLGIWSPSWYGCIYFMQYHFSSQGLVGKDNCQWIFGIWFITSLILALSRKHPSESLCVQLAHNGFHSSWNESPTIASCKAQFQPLGSSRAHQPGSYSAVSLFPPHISAQKLRACFFSQNLK